ncbi:hypothetical protein DFJ74DRAFT_695088 [Hyaloraphidium curvatum]|nr:hypothetical protein DFJ74DRAFT_695088 [Hyaloraphidium curvatum]
MATGEGAAARRGTQGSQLTGARRVPPQHHGLRPRCRPKAAPPGPRRIPASSGWTSSSASNEVRPPASPQGRVPHPSPGFLPAYLHIRSEVEKEFGKAVWVTGAAPPKPPPYKFEVTVDGETVHSYINGDGMVDREWKLYRIFDAVEAALAKKRGA